MTDIAAAAAALAAARREGRILDSLPGGFPAGLDEAYAVQDALIDAMGEAVQGWKVALTNPVAQERMQATEPAAGPLYASYIQENPASLSMPDPSSRISECEFAFQLSTDLPERDHYTDDDITAVLGSVHPAIEIADRRLGGDVPMIATVVIADHGGNGAFAYGPGTEDWRAIDFATHEISHLINGEEKARGSGAAVMGGNPVGSITWLANHLRGRGMRLREGQWVSTGLATEMLVVPEDGTITGVFGVLGSVEVRFST